MAGLHGDDQGSFGTSKQAAGVIPCSWSMLGRDVEYGIQRRSIYLIPPRGEGLMWFFSLFDEQEIWAMFGFKGPSRHVMMRRYREGNLVVGLLYRVKDRKRIGFVVMYPPTDVFDFWEFGYAITDPADRDGYSAFSATDAMAHYMFDHLRVDAMGWRTRADNKKADAVVRRLGYKAFDSWKVDGHMYTFYRLDQPGWAKRRARLEAGEEKHPSGLGAAFLTLPDPPFDPVDPEPEGSRDA